LKDYNGDIKVVYKHFVVHPSVATVPALSACAAHKQGKFEKMEHLIWEKGYGQRAQGGLSPENMKKLAAEAGLNMGQYEKDIEGACKAEVAKDQEDLRKVGVSGTPAFYINGRFLSGARPIDQFKAIIDEELKKANTRIGDGGATPETYYDQWVLAKGKKSL